MFWPRLLSVHDGFQYTDTFKNVLYHWLKFYFPVLCVKDKQNSSKIIIGDQSTRNINYYLPISLWHNIYWNDVYIETNQLNFSTLIPGVVVNFLLMESTDFTVGRGLKEATLGWAWPKQATRKPGRPAGKLMQSPGSPFEGGLCRVPSSFLTTSPCFTQCLTYHHPLHHLSSRLS